MHASVESAPSEKIHRFFNPIPKSLSVSDCLGERSVSRFSGLGSLWVASALPEIGRGFEVLIKPYIKQ